MSKACNIYSVIFIFTHTHTHTLSLVAKGELWFNNLTVAYTRSDMLDEIYSSR